MNLFKTKKQKTQELVKEIHKEFLNEVDVLLKEAGIIKEPPSVNNDVISRAEILRKIGFVSSKEVQDAEIEMNKIRSTEAENLAKQVLSDAINYFSVKYPCYKFITEESIKRICTKYSLVFGESGDYIGTIPERNLKTIEEFAIDEDDKYIDMETKRLKWLQEQHNSAMNEADDSKKAEMMRYFSHISDIYFRMRPLDNGKLKIAAPRSDFKTENMRVDGHTIKKGVPDPVVFQPVQFKGKKFYLIVTAWGDEAGDELVVNQKMN